MIIMIIWPQLADHCVTIVSYIATTFVAVRLGYSAKTAIENYKKISAEMRAKQETIIYNGEEKIEDEEEPLG